MEGFNPETGYRIKIGGPKYQELLSKGYTKEDLLFQGQVRSTRRKREDSTGVVSPRVGRNESSRRQVVSPRAARDNSYTQERQSQLVVPESPTSESSVSSTKSTVQMKEDDMTSRTPKISPIAGISTRSEPPEVHLSTVKRGSQESEGSSGKISQFPRYVSPISHGRYSSRSSESQGSSSKSIPERTIIPTLPTQKSEGRSDNKEVIVLLKEIHGLHIFGIFKAVVNEETLKGIRAVFDFLGEDAISSTFMEPVPYEAAPGSFVLVKTKRGGEKTEDGRYSVTLTLDNDQTFHYDSPDFLKGVEMALSWLKDEKFMKRAREDTLIEFNEIEITKVDQ